MSSILLHCLLFLLNRLRHFCGSAFNNCGSCFGAIVTNAVYDEWRILFKQQVLTRNETKDQKVNFIKMKDALHSTCSTLHLSSLKFSRNMVIFKLLWIISSAFCLVFLKIKLMSFKFGENLVSISLKTSL